MKKPLIALSIVCASALALADSAQYNEAWFSGIGQDATLDDMKATNGSWEIPAESASVESAALVLDLDSDEAATFTIGGVDGDSGETGTAQALTVTGIFTPIAAEGLLSGTKMAEAGAQVGFAVVSATTTSEATETEAAATTTTYKYYAWVGGASAAADASPLADWVDLGTATDVDKAKTITIGLSYWTDTVTATFALIGTDMEPSVLKSDVALSGAALETAKTNKKIASVSCTGSGTLNALSGAYQYAVAEAEGRKFGTAVEAIAAAQATGGSGNVILRRDVNGEVSVSGGLRLHYDTSVSGRNQNIQENFKIAESSAQTKVTSNAGSPLIEGWGYKEWALPNDVLLNVKINDQQIGSQTGIFAGDFNSKFTDWLMNNCSASRESAATATTVQEALTGTTGKNGYLLWQSYVMGVDADEAVKLAPATTDAEDGIALTLTSTIPDSPFASAIKYTVYKDGASVGEAMSIGTRTSPVVKIPLATGKYSVSFTIE